MNKKQKAVSLRYPENADAPYISAIGVGSQAEKILRIAAENNIPVINDSNLTNVLAIQNVGDLIPEETYTAIARIFAFIGNIEDN